jgi:putative ABC transport system permease protein
VLDTLARDTRLAVRSLLRTPGFTVAAVITLGIGLGGTASMLTTASAAFRQPLAAGNGERVVHIWQTSQRSNQISVPLKVGRDWEASLQSIESLGMALGAGTVNVTNGADAERAARAQVSRAFFATLGVSPALGRGFSAEESSLNGPLAVVISDALWERMFARSPTVLESSIRVEGVSYPIVGVMPRGFSYPLTADLWTTFERAGPEGYGDRTAHNFEVLARLKPGVSMSQAQEELTRVNAQLFEAHEQMRNEGFGVRMSDLRTDLLDTSATALWILTGAVGCVLLIACANVANLLLARAVTRESQATLRVALGATPRDLLRLFLVESVVLSVAGTAVGALLVIWSSSIATRILPAGLTATRIAPDPSVILVVALIMLGVGIACGLPSALHSARLDLRTAISAGTRSLAREPRGMSILTGIEVAVACVLLIGAGLLIRSLTRLEVVDPGFQVENIVLTPFSLGAAPGSPYAEPVRRAQFLDGALERTRAVPGVVHAGITSSLPFAFSPNAGLEAEGEDPAARAQRPSTHYRVVGGEYFQALGVPLRGGRYFTDQDRGGAPLVAILNVTAAKQMWQTENAVGRRVRIRSSDGVAEFATVVGVVADMRHRGLTQPPVMEVFFPYAQRPFRTFATALVVRTTSDPSSAIPALRSAVRETDPSVPSAFTMLRDRVDLLVAPARFRTRLLTAFALVALALSAVGLFAVVSYAVARRTREIGIRMALGADARQVQRLVVWRGMIPVLAGTVAGGWAAVLLAKYVSGLVFQITPHDPAAFAAAIVLLPAVALFATWLPARRATRIDPTTALRAE